MVLKAAATAPAAWTRHTQVSVCYHPATSAATGTLPCNALRLLYCWAGCCTVPVLGATAVPGCWVARNLLVSAFGEQLLTYQAKRAPLLSAAAAAWPSPWTDSRLLSAAEVSQSTLAVCVFQAGPSNQCTSPGPSGSGLPPGPFSSGSYATRHSRLRQTIQGCIHPSCPSRPWRGHRTGFIGQKPIQACSSATEQVH